MRKRAFLWSFLLGLIILLPQSLQAAPPAQEGVQAVISTPRDNAPVRGKVSIRGSAMHPNFWKYEIAYAPEPATDQMWVMIGPEHTNQVNNDLLETWDTTLVPDGVYNLRLRVVDITGNYQEYHVRRILVVNTQPTDTPTPPPTPTPGIPTPTPTPEPPTPTISIELPILPSPTPKPTPTPGETRQAMAVGVTPEPAGGAPPPAAIEPGKLGKSFCYGALVMIGVFLFFGLLSLLRRVVLTLTSGLE